MTNDHTSSVDRIIHWKDRTNDATPCVVVSGNLSRYDEDFVGQTITLPQTGARYLVTHAFCTGTHTVHGQWRWTLRVERINTEGETK